VIAAVVSPSQLASEASPNLCSAKTPCNAEKRGFGEQNLATVVNCHSRGSDAMIDVDELSQVEPVGTSRSLWFGE
jgi:hypothetical protein